MSEQHPNPRNKVPGRMVGSRITHNERKTAHSHASRVATAQERQLNSMEDPPNRAGKAARRAKAKAAK